MADIKKTIRVSAEIDAMIKKLQKRPEMQTERQVIETAISYFFQKCNGKPFSDDELNYIFSKFAKSPIGTQLRLNCRETNILQKTHMDILNSLLHSRQIANPDYLSVSALPHPLYTDAKKGIYEKIQKSKKEKEWQKCKKDERSEKG